MYKQHDDFHTPGKGTTAWRYLDFTKFVDMLITRQLFFCRADYFADPFEGVFKLKDYEQSKKMLRLFTETKKYYFLSCWHMNRQQSDAMWKIFAHEKNGMAIKSSVGKIIKALEPAKEDIYIGKILYRDLENLTMHELVKEAKQYISKKHGKINQFNYKRLSFEHEKELRLYYIDRPLPGDNKQKKRRRPLHYKRVTVDLNSLIDEVVISPFADIWFKDLVVMISAKLGFNFRITQSELYSTDIPFSIEPGAN